MKEPGTRTMACRPRSSASSPGPTSGPGWSWRYRGCARRTSNASSSGQATTGRTRPPRSPNAGRTGGRQSARTTSGPPRWVDPSCGGPRRAEGLWTNPSRGPGGRAGGWSA
eukprot:8754497-Alexandrium_andersonii.AAC.1